MIIRPRVYLAGPITGCTKGEAFNWRNYVIERLEPHGIVGVNPLRCEPLRAGAKVYKSTAPDPKFGTARAIGAKNLFDVKQCEMTLAYLPKPGRRGRQSYGTIGEMFWANALGRMTLLVTDDPYVEGHPTLDCAANWKLRTLDEAVEVIVGVLSVYSEARLALTGGTPQAA